jgi:hypothetical protein
MQFYLTGVIIQLALFIAIILLPFVEEEGRFVGYILGIAAILYLFVSPIMIILSLIRWYRVGFSWDILLPTIITILLFVYFYYNITSLYP